MRNVMKAATIESKFPLLSVEHDCIVSKDADITVAFRVELPELFTVTSAEYEAIHAAWVKAIKVLPDYTVILKQDWFVSEKYHPQTGDGDMSFLSRSYERHFNERPFLNHSCFLFITKTTKERMRMQSNFSSLCRGHIIPKEVNKETAQKFLEAVGQFERIVNDSGFVTLTRLTSDEITGTPENAGLIEKYFALSLDDTTCLQDMELGADGLRIGSNHVCVHPSPTRKTCRGALEPTRAMKNYRPTEATVCYRSPRQWDCCSRATTSTTSICFWMTAPRTFGSLKNQPEICSRFRATRVATKSIRSGSTIT